MAGLGDDAGYAWERGVEHVGPLPVTFLIGRPAG